MDVQMRVIRVGMQLMEDSNVMVVWKHGSKEDCSDPFKMKHSQDEVNVNLKFKTLSTFYYNDQGKWEEKLCEFQLYKLDDGGKKLIGK